MSNIFKIKKTAAILSLTVAAPFVMYGGFANASTVPENPDYENTGCGVLNLKETVPEIYRESTEGLKISYRNNTSPSKSDGCILSENVYVWDFGDGASFTLSQSEIYHVYEKSGSYDVSVYSFNRLTGRKSEVFTETVTVKDTDPVAVIHDITQDDQNGDTYHLSGLSSGSKSGKRIISYLWSTGETTSDIQYRLNGSDTPERISLTVTDEDGNSDTRYQEIYPHNVMVECGVPPKYTMWLHFVTEKDGLNVNFHDHISNDIGGMCPLGIDSFRLPAVQNGIRFYATDFLWNFGDGTTSTEKAPVHTYEHSGTYPVSIAYITSDMAHTATQNVTVDENFLSSDEVKALISASIRDGESVLPGQEVILRASGSFSRKGKIVSYLWSTGEYDSSITVNPTKTTAYSVTVLDSNNNSSTASYTVNVDADKERETEILIPIYGERSITENVNSGTKVRVTASLERGIPVDSVILLTDGISKTVDGKLKGVINGNTEFKAIADKGDHSYSRATVYFIVDENGPKAKISKENGPNPEISSNYRDITVGEILNFSGSKSTGDSLSYEWLLDGSSKGNKAEFSTRFNESGIHVVTLRITDANGKTSTATDIIAVDSLTASPSDFVISTSAESVKIGEEAVFWVKGNESDHRSYFWYVDDIRVRESQEPDFAYRFFTPGTHEIKAVAIGAGKAPYSAVKTVVVTDDSEITGLKLEFADGNKENRKDIPFITTDSDMSCYDGLLQEKGELMVFSIGNIMDKATVTVIRDNGLLAPDKCQIREDHEVNCDTDEGTESVLVENEGVIGLMFNQTDYFRIQIEARLLNGQYVSGFIPVTVVSSNSVETGDETGGKGSRSGGAMSPLTLMLLGLAGLCLRRNRRKHTQDI